MEKPELVNRLTLDFLAPVQVTKLFAIDGTPETVDA
jgi:hypothetical protein